MHNNENFSTQEYLSSYDYQSDTSMQENIGHINIENLKTLNLQSDILIYFEKEFRKILQNYMIKIKQMCSVNSSTLNIKYKDIQHLDLFFQNNSNDFFKLFNKILMEVVDYLFPNYRSIHRLLYVRIDYPTLTSIRDLKSGIFDRFLSIEGIVTKRSEILKAVYKAIFICTKCNATATEFEIENYFLYTTDNKENSYKKIIGLRQCEECQSGPFILSKKSVYKSVQRFSLQEIANSKIPQSVECILWGDQIDTVKPGMKVKLSGVFRVIKTNKLKQIFLVNSINYENTIKPNFNIRDLMFNANVKDLFVKSFAPHVFGLDKVKMSILCALFGGVRKENLRGDINILLMGDPGTAKSQLLRQIPNLVSRCILASGQGASSVGLTATVKKEYNEWILEGGALVLADTGVCCIDEFDKMNSHDRVSIHEAMEQQSISVSKAGIVTTLNARTTILAAANPRFGNYNRNLRFKNNVNLEDPIISRFDVINILVDEIDSEKDLRTSNFVLKSHAEYSSRVHNLEIDQKDLIPYSVMKDYIAHARTINPILHETGQQKIKDVYIELRKGSKETNEIITPRNIESIIRLAEAFARMRLSPYVSAGDINSAISLVVESFIDCQKFSLRKLYRKRFSKFLEYSKRDLLNVALFVLNDMFSEKIKYTNSNKIIVKILDVQRRIQKYGVELSEEELIELAKSENYAHDGKFIIYERLE